MRGVDTLFERGGVLVGIFFTVELHFLPRETYRPSSAVMDGRVLNFNRHKIMLRCVLKGLNMDFGDFDAQ